MGRGDDVAIVGAGLSGSLMAILLARRGHRVTVYDRRPDPRTEPGAAGRSINLGLSQRGITALTRAGLLDQVLAAAAPMRGRMVHHRDGSLAFHPYGTDESQILHSILRHDLNTLLVSTAAALPGVRFEFGAKLTGLRRGDAGARPVCRFETDRPGGAFEVAADVVVGADGSYSKVRADLQRGLPADFQQTFLPWGYQEFSIPAAAGADRRRVPDSLHVWPGSDGLVVAHPNADRSLTATLFMPHHGPAGFDRLASAADYAALLRERFPDLLEIAPQIPDELAANPVGHLVTVRTSMWQHAGRIVLIGDAAHAVYPFYGQGMNSALEDCLVLDDCLDQAADDWRVALPRFESLRKPHTDVLADLSEQNFEELRTHVTSPLFVLHRKADLLLNRLLGDRWLPLYTMISHTTTPYGEALRRARGQRAALATTAVVATCAAILGIGAAVRRPASDTEGGTSC